MPRLRAGFRPTNALCLRCAERGLSPIVCRSLVLPTSAERVPAPTHLRQRASLLAAEPVVTTRRFLVPTRRYVALAQVTSPSDGLPDPSSSS